MILVILAVGLALLVGGSVVYFKCRSDVEAVGFAMGVVGGIIAAVALIATLALGITVSGLPVIDDRIAMYQEENAKIEAQIAEVVQQYQQYETDIFTEVAPESAMTLVALYPELKSDSLVESQIELYINNNNQIRALREEKITGSVSKWWLYFGS